MVMMSLLPSLFFVEKMIITVSINIFDFFFRQKAKLLVCYGHDLFWFELLLYSSIETTVFYEFSGFVFIKLLHINVDLKQHHIIVIHHIQQHQQPRISHHKTILHRQMANNVVFFECVGEPGHRGVGEGVVV